MDLTGKLTRSQKNYVQESDNRSNPEVLDNTDFEEAATTQSPYYPESAQIKNGGRQSHTSLSSRGYSFPYQPSPIIDDRLHELALKHEIQEKLAERLRALEDYKIVLLCDDSGSMKTMVDNSNRTRWDELRDFVKIVLEVATIFDPTGVDIHFLNRPPIYNVTDPRSVDHIFSTPPRGYTPLVAALTYIFQLPASQHGNDKELLVFVATDGAPTDNKGNINVSKLEHLMIHERNAETTHVMFLICTDDPACVDYLNDWDEKMINVDVTDDFKTEREKIRKYQGPYFPFSKGDYIVKALIGAVDPEINDLNQPRHTNHNNY